MDKNLLTRTVVAGVIVEELKALKLHPSVVSEEQRLVEAKELQRLKIVCFGAHPDDAESGCGGTLARYSALGHTVTIIYLTRGESGKDRSHEEAAAVRSAESAAACKILGAKPLFAGQIDGATVIDAQGAQTLSALIESEHADIVLTHWPIDTHLDHQVASTLALRAGLIGGRRFELYYYEVYLGFQTMGFHPTDYVDISPVREQKKAALWAHKSQHGEEIYRRHHEVMENFRGREAGVAAAEAFIRLPQLSVAPPMLGTVVPSK